VQEIYKLKEKVHTGIALEINITGNGHSIVPRKSIVRRGNFNDLTNPDWDPIMKRQLP
jgi:hypothetical protein